MKPTTPSPDALPTPTPLDAALSAWDHAPSSQYRAILEAAMDGFWAISSDGTIVDVNSAYCALSGYTRDELVGRPVREIDSEHDQHAVAHRLDEIRRFGHTRFETRHRRKDGKLIEVEVSSRRTDPSMRLTFVFIHDITRRRMQERLLMLHARILEALNAGGSDREVLLEILRWIQAKLDLQSLAIRMREGEDYPFYVSLGFDEAFLSKEKGLCAHDAQGRPLKTHAGTPVYECLCGAVLAGNRDFWPLPLTQGGCFWTNQLSEEVRRIKPGQEPPFYRGFCPQAGFESMALLPVKSEGKMIGLLQLHDKRRDRFSAEAIEVLEKITESIGAAVVRSRAELRLAITSERLSLATRSARLGIWDWDLTTQRMVWDERMLDMYGLGREAFSQTVDSWVKALHHDDAERALGECRTALEGGKPFDTEFRIVRPGGEVRTVKAEAHVLRDGKGRPLRMTGVNHDITEARRQLHALDEALRRKQDSLSRAQSLQRRLNTHVLPHFHHIDLQGLYLPCEELGGDLLLVYRSGPPGEALFASPTDKLVILLADCTGHGLETSMYATLLVTLAESFLNLFETGNETAEFLRRLNQRIAHFEFEDQFPTLFVAVLEHASASLHYSNANGVLPLYRASSDQPFQTIPAVAGAHLGFDVDSMFGQNTLALEPGADLVFFSDAWFERESDISIPVSERIQRFSLDLESIYASPIPAGKRIERLVTHRFPTHQPQDDLTLLCLSARAPFSRHWDVHTLPETADVEKILRAALSARAWADDEIESIALAFGEIAENGLRHGNRLDPVRTLRIEAELDCERVAFTLRDEGPGFDPSAVPDPSDPARLKKLLETGNLPQLTSGRGLFLARRYMTVQFLGKGNEVRLSRTRARPRLLFREHLAPG